MKHRVDFGVYIIKKHKCTISRKTGFTTEDAGKIKRLSEHYS